MILEILLRMMLGIMVIYFVVMLLLVVPLLLTGCLMIVKNSLRAGNKFEKPVDDALDFLMRLDVLETWLTPERKALVRLNILFGVLSSLSVAGIPWALDQIMFREYHSPAWIVWPLGLLCMGTAATAGLSWAASLVDLLCKSGKDLARLA